MSKLQAIYSKLRQIDDPVVDMAMSQALVSADNEARRLLVLILLERGEEKPLAEVIRLYHELDKDLQQIIIHHAVDLDGALRRTTTHSDDFQGRSNCIEIVIQSLSFRLAYLVSDLMKSDNSRLTRMAAQGLLELSEHVSNVSNDQGVSISKLQIKRIAWLENALADAAATYGKHGRKDIVLAIASLAPRKLPAVMRHLASPHAPIHKALVSHLLNPRHSVIGRAMLSYAQEESLHYKVVEALSRKDVAHVLGDILEGGHLITIPKVKSTIRHVAMVEHLIPDDEARYHWPATRQRQLTRWFDALRVDEKTTIEYVSELATLNDPVARFNALRYLINAKHDDAMDGVAIFCFDIEQPIARVALRYLILHQWVGLTRLLPRLLHSPHKEIVFMAEAAFLPNTFERLWDQWLNLVPEVRLAAGRTLIRIDREFKSKLAKCMKHKDYENRLQAVMIARSLKITSYYEKELIGLVNDPSEKVVSAVVGALGYIDDTPEIVEALTRALDHENDRVRANAIESIERIERVEVTQHRLLELANTREGNRSRANAIKALFNLPFGEALSALKVMLEDEDPRHRISGLWVVNESSLFDIAELVGNLALADTSDEVRRRAGLSLRQLAETRKMNSKHQYAYSELESSKDDFSRSSNQSSNWAKTLRQVDTREKNK